MERIGILVLLIGAGLVVGYLLSEAIPELFGSDELPGIVKAGIGLIIAGFLTILYTVVRERWQARHREDLDEVEP